MSDTPANNQAISLAEFDQIPSRGRTPRLTPEIRALLALSLDTALVFASHGNYTHRTSGCAFGGMAHRIAKKRGAVASTKHLEDGRVAVAFYRNGN